MSYVDGILGQDEQIIAKAKVRKIVLLGAWIKGILLFFLLIPLIDAIKFTISIMKIELALTNKRLVGKVGIIARQIMDSKLNKIQSIKIEETFFGRLFGYATVVVVTAGTHYEFQAIASANEFKNKVMNQIEEFDNCRIQKQAQALAGAIQ